MRLRLTEDKLHQLIYECVRQVINESKPGIQSKKLYTLMQQYGGLKKGNSNCLDIHNLKDEDIIKIMPKSVLRQLTSDKRYEVDHGKWAENYGLDAWAKSEQIKTKPGDRMSYLELGDGENVVIVINRNENQVQGREGEGWDAYHQKREKRRNDREHDGSERYIPKHKRPWAYSRQWKNPYKKTNSWNRDAIDKDMDSIRDYHAKGDNRERNY